MPKHREWYIYGIYIHKTPVFMTFRVSQHDIINDNLLKFGSLIG
jgi:hypothetical protein